MSAGTYDISIDQNASLQIDIYWNTDTNPPTTVDVTGYHGKMQIRSGAGSPTALETLTDANGGLVIGTTDGHIQILMTAAETNAITWTSGVYDLFMTSPGGFTTKLLQGTVTVSQAVTLI